ncbi:MAG: hypothetical protein KAH32_04385 [Chlamydiia bacterium]|nr:hypothetical protein [Chlamydiia bacterium]
MAVGGEVINCISPTCLCSIVIDLTYKSVPARTSFIFLIAIALSVVAPNIFLL